MGRTPEKSTHVCLVQRTKQDHLIASFPMDETNLSSAIFVKTLPDRAAQ
jgi:hypothetical protein